MNLQKSPLFDFRHPSRREVAISSASQKEQQESWGKAFSHPTKHDNGESWCYLVHGLQDQMARIMQHMFLIDECQKKKQSFDPSQNIDLLQNPEGIASKKLVSTSIITQEHTDTFGDVGFILKSPFANVQEMSGEDMGTNFSDPDSILKNNLGNKCTVEELMQRSKEINKGWNEVLLSGETRQGKIEVVGVFIRKKINGVFNNPELAKIITSKAKERNLPIIYLEDPLKMYEDSPLESKRMLPHEPIWGLTVNRGGTRYVYDFYNGKDNFNICTPEGKNRIMTPEEFNIFKDILESELDPESKKELKTRLAKLNENYKNCI